VSPQKVGLSFCNLVKIWSRLTYRLSRYLNFLLLVMVVVRAYPLKTPYQSSNALHCVLAIQTALLLFGPNACQHKMTGHTSPMVPICQTSRMG
jgi:hypothetical protein